MRWVLLCHIFTVEQMTQIVRRHQQAAVDTSSAIVVVFSDGNTKYKIWNRNTKYNYEKTILDTDIKSQDQTAEWVSPLPLPNQFHERVQCSKSNIVFQSFVLWLVIMTQKDIKSHHGTIVWFNQTDCPFFLHYYRGCRSSFGSCAKKKGPLSNSRNAFIASPLLSGDNHCVRTTTADAEGKCNLFLHSAWDASVWGFDGEKVEMRH